MAVRSPEKTTAPEETSDTKLVAPVKFVTVTVSIAEAEAPATTSRVNGVIVIVGGDAGIWA